MSIEQFIVWLAKIAISLVAAKTLIGFHFPWEICGCCGKKYKEHKKEI